MTAPAAVVFDFDGLLVDTEWAIYEMARTAFAASGHDLEVAVWADIIGLADVDDGWTRVVAAQGWEVDRDAWNEVYWSQDRRVRDHLPAMPGVEALTGALVDVGVALGVASSSDRTWVVGHLDRLGLTDRFATLATVERAGGVGKPAPDVYRLACADLDVDPVRAVAIEDSANGIASARAAGMLTVAVPNRITVHNDLSAADHQAESLEQLSVAYLAALAPAG